MKFYLLFVCFSSIFFYSHGMRRLHKHNSQEPLIMQPGARGNSDPGISMASPRLLRKKPLSDIVISDGKIVWGVWEATLFKAIQDGDEFAFEEAIVNGACLKAQDPATLNTILIEAVLAFSKRKKNTEKRKKSFNILKKIFFAEEYDRQIDFMARNKNGLSASDIAKAYEVFRLQFYIDECIRGSNDVRHSLVLDSDDALDGLKVVTTRVADLLLKSDN